MVLSKRSRNSAISSRPSSKSTSLPPYQAPAHPLNQDAQRAFRELPKNHRLDGLISHLSNAGEHLTQVAGDLNYRHLRHATAHQKRKARRQGNDEACEEDDQALEEMQSNVDEMTAKFEEGVRRIIDAKVAVESVQIALKEIHTNVASSQAAVQPSQSTHSISQPRQKRHRPAVDSSDEESGAEEVSDQSQPLGVFKGKITKYNSEYENLSVQNRYASNNDYIGFKQIVHESKHPDGHAPPMPHPSTWFSRSPGGDGDQHGKGDIDDDIQVASERISIKCPLTLLEMEDPVSSNKCPHSFERTAILGMISASQVRIKRADGKIEQHMKCPVCEMLLSASDLHRDIALLRKIKRIQAAQAAPESDSDSDLPEGTLAGTLRGSQRRMAEQLVDSDENEDGDGDRLKREKTVKAEGGGGRRREREVSMVPATQLGGTQIVDLEEEEE